MTPTTLCHNRSLHNSHRAASRNPEESCCCNQPARGADNQIPGVAMCRSVSVRCCLHRHPFQKNLAFESCPDAPALQHLSWSSRFCTERSCGSFRTPSHRPAMSVEGQTLIHHSTSMMGHHTTWIIIARTLSRDSHGGDLETWLESASASRGCACSNPAQVTRRINTH